MELKDTIEGMTSTDYQARFKAEYQQLKIRWEKLNKFCNRIRASEFTGIDEPEHDCPVGLLKNQLEIMREYLTTLEIRAILEDIDLRD